MQFSVLKSKIHMARITDKHKEYEGSITIDKRLAEAADMVHYERVLVADVENGNRFTTYVILGDEGEICVNGAAANLVEVGDRVIIMSFAMTEGKDINPTVIKVDRDNKIIE